MKKIILMCFLSFVTFTACSNTTDDDRSQDFNQMDDHDTDGQGNENEETDTISTNTTTIKILTLGDSYTIGQSVCETCKFPVQLKDSLAASIEADVSVDIIARTGWTTTSLINAIETETISSDYDLVTLLIGVNNQYQNKPFDLYQTEFPMLVQKAIRFAQSDKNNVIVISIPDYAFTPFGQNSSNAEQISTQLDQYNAFAKTYCEGLNITFINITDITRLGLEQPTLVASDGLHPSKLAYSKFVERILPIAIEKLQ